MNEIKKNIEAEAVKDLTRIAHEALNTRAESEKPNLKDAVKQFIEINQETWKGQNPTEYLNDVREKDDERIAALESDLEYLNRWKTLIESAPEFEVQKIAVERFLKTDGMRPFLAHFKTRIKELETENERLSAEVEKWKRLAGKKAI